MSQDVYEVKILRQVKFLPKVFMIKQTTGHIIKISLLQTGFIDCTKYVSRSGVTFNGCFRLQNGELVEIKGIYYVPIPPIFSIGSRQKITRNVEEMKEYIKRTLETYNLLNQELLISYDNYGFNIYDKYIKGQLFEFQLIGSQGHLEVYEVPKPNPSSDIQFEETNEFVIYNHKVKFEKNIRNHFIYANGGLANLVYPTEKTNVLLESPDHGQQTITLQSEKYYLFVHQRPRNRKID